VPVRILYAHKRRSFRAGSNPGRRYGSIGTRPEAHEMTPLTVAQAAAALGVGRHRIVRLINTGRLRATRFGVRAYAIAPRDLDAVRVRPNGRPPKVR
jgi:excisionase family DNA binding protein